MGPYRWKTGTTSLKEVLSPPDYLTVCPLISHIYFVLLYQSDSFCPEEAYSK